MLEKLLELDDILLFPAELNSGLVNQSKFNFAVLDEVDKTASLPIFTLDSDNIVSKENWQEFNKNGIRPILPVTEELNIRLEGCQFMFTSFTLNEIKSNFLMTHRTTSNIFRINIDNDYNGHDTELFNVASALKKMYGSQVNIMAGNLGNPKTYVNYCKAGIDYVRVGLSTSSLIDQDVSGFYYPMASLLLDVIGVRSTACVGLKHTKIIADGGISNHVDIIKALALGADYVMIGRQFARLVEAAGTIYKKEKTENGDKLEEVAKGTLAGVPISDYKDLELKRLYCTKSKTSSLKGDCWVKVNSNLPTWLKGMYETFNTGFIMAGALNWKDYKTNIKFCRVQ